jgi:hypothetical protein
MLYGPTAFWTVLTTVRDACVGALRDAGDAPSRVAVVPGAIAWDDCNDCGLLALASTRNFLSDQFPSEVASMTMVNDTQGSLLCADMAVQIIRCAPQPEGNALAPTPAALEASAKLVVADAYAVMCGTIDALTKTFVAGDIVDYMVRQQVFVGPSGACVGSELSFVVAVIR